MGIVWSACGFFQLFISFSLGLESGFQAVEPQNNKKQRLHEKTIPAFLFISSIRAQGAVRRYAPFSDPWNGEERFIFYGGARERSNSDRSRTLNSSLHFGQRVMSFPVRRRIFSTRFSSSGGGGGVTPNDFRMSASAFFLLVCAKKP